MAINDDPVYKRHVKPRRKQLDPIGKYAGMQQLVHVHSGSYEAIEEQRLLQLYSKLVKSKFTDKAHQRNAAKTMFEFTKRHYDHVNGTSPSEQSNATQKAAARVARHGPTLNMLSHDGALLWECETSGPNGNTLFVFDAQLLDDDGVTVKSMYDTGASGNFVTMSFVNQHKLHRTSCPIVKVTVASNKIVECSQLVKVPIVVGTYHALIPALVLPNDLDVDLILGTAWQNTLHKGRITTCTEDRTIEFGHKGKRHTIVCHDPPLPNESESMNLTFDLINQSTATDNIHFWMDPERKGWTEADHKFYDQLKAEGTDLPCYLLRCVNESVAVCNRVKKEGSFEVKVGDDVDDDPIPGMESRVEQLRTNEHAIKVFTEDMSAFDPNGKTPVSAIPLKEEAWSNIPFRRAHRMGIKESEACLKQIQELLEKGYIRTSTSSFGSPVMMVPKPHQPDKLRMVIDYRALNKLTMRNRYPLPNVDQMFEELQGAKVFSAFDAIWGFWQLPLVEEDIPKTAMVTPHGSFEWKALPMGLTNAPSVFMQTMADICRDLKFVKVFIDDLLVFSNTIEEHAEHLRVLMERLAKHKIQLKESKAKWFQKSVKFLGHVVSSDGIKPQAAKVEAIRQWKPPTSVTEVRQFLGLVGFYRRYILNFADKAKALNELCQKGAVIEEGVTFAPGSRALQAFEALQIAMTQAPVLILPDQQKAEDGSAPYVLQTDASGFAVGAVLMQDLGKGLQPIGFISKSLNAAEQNYSTTERELLAIVNATIEWRHLLQGRQYVLQGDHKPLEALMSPGKELTRRQARWVEKLIEVGVPEMIHVPGKSIPVPDALSRRPDHPVYSPAEGLKQELSKDPSVSSLDPDLMTMWSQPVDKFRPPDYVNTETGMVFYTSPESYSMCLETLCWMADAGCAVNPVMSGDEADTPQHHCDRKLFAAGTRRSSRNTAAPDRFNPSKEVANSKERGSHKPTVRGSPSNFKEGRRPNQVKAKRNKHPVALQNSDWMLMPEYFEWIHDTYGPFDVDACCNEDGSNKQPECPEHWSEKRSCFTQDWEGKRVYCNPPYEKEFVDALFKRFRDARARNPSTFAVFVLPRKLVPTIVWQNDHNFEEVKSWNTTLDQEMFRSAANIPTACNQEVVVLLGKSNKELGDYDIEVNKYTPSIMTYDDVALIDKLKSAYAADVQLQQELKEIMADPRAHAHKRSHFGGFLWRTESGHLQLYVPNDRDLKQTIIREFHESAHAGHQSYKRTLEKIRRRFWWNGMFTDVKNFCDGCHICQMSNASTNKPNGALNPLSIPKRRWETVTMDFIVGLPTSAAGYDSVLTVTDKLTKRIHLIPLKYGKAGGAEVARLFFDNVWKLHGAPRKIVTDRDSRFTTPFWNTLNKLMGVQVNMTTAYNPKGDGQSENTNKTVEAILRKFVNHRQTNWAEKLAAVEYAINDSVHSATGFTPFKLDTGTDPCTNVDFVLDAVKSSSSSRGNNQTAMKFLEELKNDLQMAREELKKANEASKKQYDKKRAHRTQFEVGDLVALRIEDFTLPKDRDTRWKLRPKYAGPFKVVDLLYSELYHELQDKSKSGNISKSDKDTLEQLQPIACRLQLPDSWSRHHDVFPIDKLKKYNAKQQWPCQRLPPVPEPVKIGEDDEDVVYVVDRILDDKMSISTRGKSRERHWLVGFEGFSDEHNEWLPEWSINTYTDENGEKVVNETWKRYEEKRERRLQEASGRTHYLNYSVDTQKFSTEVLHRTQRSLRILILNYHTGDEMYETLRNTYPNSKITTVGEGSGPFDPSGNTAHIRLSPMTLSVYELYAILGSPKIDVMVVNAPKMTNVKFVIDEEDRKTEFSRRKDAEQEFEKCMERMFTLFQLVAPTYWIFTGFLATKKSKSRRLAHLQWCKYLNSDTFQGQAWTNLDFDKGRNQLDLTTPRGRQKLIHSGGNFRNDLHGSGDHIGPTYSVKYEMADDYDDFYPNYETAKERNLPVTGRQL